MARTIHLRLETKIPWLYSWWKHHCELRNFALQMAVMIPLIFYVTLPILFGLQKRNWPLVVACFFVFFGIIYPYALDPIKTGWMKLAHFIGAINSRIILGFIYFLLFVPISLILRTLGKDPMQSQFDKKLTTYKIKPEKNDLIERMEKPF